MRDMGFNDIKEKYWPLTETEMTIISVMKNECLLSSVRKEIRKQFEVIIAFFKK